MGKILILGDPPIDVALRRSARARRISLRVSGLDGRVSLTIPARGALAEAEAFLHQKEPWIRKQMARTVPSEPIAIGTSIPIEGDLYRLVAGSGRKIVAHGDTLAIPGDPARLGAILRGYLKALARDRLAHASARYAATVERPFGKLTLRDTRSRWGSCSSQGDLMYSWRLVMAPPDVLDYVAAHEVAHLIEMNHSPAFWEIVARLMPDYAEHRAWLRQNGSTLHRFII